MKFLLTEKQLERLKFFLKNKKEATKLLESKLKDKVELKTPEPLGVKKEEKKKEEPKKIEPKIDKSVLKITSVSQLEKVLQVVGEHNKGLKVPTKLKSKFENVLQDIFRKAAKNQDHLSSSSLKNIFEQKKYHKLFKQ